MKKNLKIMIVCLLGVLFISSCADSKEFTINNKQVVVEPYGWANSDARKNDSIVYEMSAGNVACSIIFCETIVVPVWLTGWGSKNIFNHHQM